MNTHEGYSKKKLDNDNVLLAGGGEKSLADFLGGIRISSSKIQYKAADSAATWTDLITLVNTDENVKLVDNNNNENIPLVLKNGTGTGTITSSVRTVDGVTVNPSKNSLRSIAEILVGATTFNSASDNVNGILLQPGGIYLNNSSARKGYYLYGNAVLYGRWCIDTIGTESVDNGDGTYTSVIGSATLALGNSTVGASNASGSVANNARGILRLYAANNRYTLIIAQGNGNRDFYLPNYGGVMYAVHTKNNNAVGSESSPVYIAANGRVTECSTTFATSGHNHDGRYVQDYGSSITVALYDIPTKYVFSGNNVVDGPTTGWISGLVLGSNWNNNHYLHYLVESDSRWYATRSYANSKMKDWNTFAYLTDIKWSLLADKPDTATRWPTWDEVTGKPSTFPPSDHDHQRILPTRHDSNAPSPKDKGASLTFQFSYFESNWWNVLNMRSYGDYNYSSTLLLTKANNPGSDTYSGDSMYWRQGRNSTWNLIKCLLDSSNYTTWCATKNHDHGPLLYINGTSDNLPRVCWHIPNVTWANISLNTSAVFSFRTGNATTGGTEYLRVGGNYIHIGGTTNATMTSSSTNPRIIFSESWGTQPVYLVYTDYDSYRSPAGLKVVGGTDASPAWFEVEGDVYARHYYESSDIRLKHDISMISKSIRKFKYNNDDKLCYGFIAQELEELHPELVDNSGEYKTVNYNSAICYYIAELENKVLKLEEKLQKLENIN